MRRDHWSNWDRLTVLADGDVPMGCDECGELDFNCTCDRCPACNDLADDCTCGYIPDDVEVLAKL